jgi:2-dehydro-3-deoxyphosphogluconate aldolase/(4S)-4-hydroxy-2-oxoglutarate aldolase
MLSHFDILQRILQAKVIAIARLDSGEALLNIAQALKAGGVNTIEFTMSTPGALEMIAQAKAALGSDVLMGAGTVLDPETARAAILAGAEFIVTPTTNVETIRLCRRYGKPIMAGALTPTEILHAWETGADFVKVFPITAVGGAEYIKAVTAPLPQVRLAPTGGISAENAASFLKAGAVALGVGGKLVDKAVVARGDWAAITSEARRLVAAIA